MLNVNDDYYGIFVKWILSIQCMAAHCEIFVKYLNGKAVHKKYSILSCKGLLLTFQCINSTCVCMYVNILLLRSILNILWNPALLTKIMSISPFS